MGWYITCWKKYADFSGRARRQEYWYFALFSFVVAIVLIIPPIVASVVFRSESYAGAVSFVTMVPYLGYCFAIIVPSLAVTVRRLHDTGRSGWWYFIAFVPFVGGIIVLVFLLSDSVPGPNVYGPNPKGVGGYWPPPPPPPPVPPGYGQPLG